MDSDGCAMDTMNIKHFRCFGPCMVEEWGLAQWEDAILKRWNEINLFSMTRGINRFKGLAVALREIDGSYCKIDDIDVLEHWVAESSELSNQALENAMRIKDSVILEKALSWSNSVNERINALSFVEKKPFEGVKEALRFAQEYADIAIVSSANLQAVLEEWEFYGLLEYVDIIMAQDVGSKAYCIGEMLKKGYSNQRVMMVGDALGDYDAAHKNNVLYYPILVRSEKESWREFKETVVKRFVDGNYFGEFQNTKIRQFHENLK